MATPRVFTRNATGFTRELGLGSALAMNLANTTLGAALLLTFGVAYLFPQGNIALSLLFGLVLFFPLGMIYAMLTAAMPRSGGDYVFVSRTLSPPVGFIVAMTLMVWNLFWSGAYLEWMFTQGLSPAFATMGTVLHATGLAGLATSLGSTSVIVVGSVALVAIVWFVAVRSTRALFAIFNASVAIGTLGVFLLMVLLLASGHSGFIRAFNAFAAPYTHTPDAYHALFRAAVAKGYNPANTGAFGPTWALLPMTGIDFMYIAAMAAIGGEIKRAQTNSYRAIYLTFLIAGAISVVTAIALDRAVSTPFLNALNWLAANDPKAYPLPAPPNYVFLGSLLTRNPVLLLIINLNLPAWFFSVYVMSIGIFIPRYLLAASLDGLLPERLSYVSERTRTPVVGITVGAVGCLIMILLTHVFASLTAALSAIAGELICAYGLVGLAAVFFPYARRSRPIFEASPIQSRLLGVPVITLYGIACTVVMAVVGYMLLSNPIYGANSTWSVIMIFAIPAFALLIYAVMWQLSRSSTLSLDLAFRELPPE